MKTIARLALLVTAAANVLAAKVSVIPTGKTFTIGNVSYFAPPYPVSKFSASLSSASVFTSVSQSSGGELVPFSVIPTDDLEFGISALEDTVKAWSEADDVWSEAFLTGVFIDYTGSQSSPRVQLTPSNLAQFEIEFVLTSSKFPGGIKLSKPLASGPYFLNPDTLDIFEAYRLYNDENQSFDYGVIPDNDGGFQILSAKVPGAATETIGVPSRLYFTPTAEKPLAGMRLAVKDIFDIKDLHTGCGNRAFFNLYPPKNATAPAIQRLIDGGMVIVGKAKTSQFANGETATDDWVDLHAPYNPRGDGYQDGSSSSTGPGTAMAAYDWLDHAVGSDTGGSMRGPSGANGVYGNRPSHGAVSLDDVMPLSPVLDTAGVFSRDAKSWAVIGHWWYQNFTSFSKYPKKILFPVDQFGTSFLTNPPANGTAGAVFNDFITQLEGFLDTKRTEFSLTALWPATKPANSTAVSLEQLLNTTYADLISLDQTSLVRTPFFADYAAANAGRTPFVDPAPVARWGYGLALPPGRRDEAIANKTTFMNWWSSKVVRDDPETCADAIYLYPQSEGRPQPRNLYISPPTAPFGFSSGRAAVHAEVPDMVVPLGEIDYNSPITNKTEKLPVTLSFVTAKNCDLMLFNLFAGLHDAGILKPVKTGPTLF